MANWLDAYEVVQAVSPSEAAALVAKNAGTTLAAGLRWHGNLAPSCLAAPLADGREVRVYRDAHGWSVQIRKEATR